MARSIDDIDPAIPPGASRGGRRDGYPTFPLLLHVIHLGGPIVHITWPVNPAGVVEYPLSRRRLAGVDVSHDPDISDHLQGDFASHYHSQIPSGFSHGYPQDTNPTKQRAHSPFVFLGSTSPLPMIHGDSILRIIAGEPAGYS